MFRADIILNSLRDSEFLNEVCERNRAGTIKSKSANSEAFGRAPFLNEPTCHSCHLWVLPAEIPHNQLQYHKWTPNLPFLVLPNEHQLKNKFLQLHRQQVWACHRRQDTTITLKFSEGGIRLSFQYSTNLVMFASTTMTASNGQSTATKAACFYLNGEPQIQSFGNPFSTLSHHECRDAYPPYGFYILNRVGMDDYISRLYPEDELFDQANILIIRSFPDFLARRLASIETSTSGQTPDKFSNIYAIPNILDLGTKQKGRFLNIGLWMQPTDSRESMLKVMKRCVIRSSKLGPCLIFFPSLHSYVKLNLPYPQEFRYGPGKPPPPHRLRAVPKNQGLVLSRQSNLFSKHVAQSPSLLLDNEIGRASCRERVC